MSCTTIIIFRTKVPNRGESKKSALGMNDTNAGQTQPAMSAGDTEMQVSKTLLLVSSVTNVNYLK